MKPDEWLKGMANEAASVEDARWAKEAKCAAWRAWSQQDASLLPGVRGQIFRSVSIGLISVLLVAFYGAVLQQIGWMSLLTGTLFCAGSLAGVGSLALACGRSRRPIWICSVLSLLSVISLGQFSGSGGPVVPGTAEFSLMGLVLLAAYAAYFYSLAALGES